MLRSEEFPVTEEDEEKHPSIIKNGAKHLDLNVGAIFYGSGSGSGSDFGQVTVPVPHRDCKKYIFQKKKKVEKSLFYILSFFTRKKFISFIKFIGKLCVFENF